MGNLRAVELLHRSCRRDEHHVICSAERSSARTAQPSTHNGMGAEPSKQARATLCASPRPRERRQNGEARSPASSVWSMSALMDRLEKAIRE
eukprot:6485936-Prymnesium_polylepis.3